MPKEIEKKFLLKNTRWKASSDTGVEIKQGYLNSVPERTVRVRVKGSKGFLTIKGKSVGATRLEYEYEIPLNEAQEMMALCEQPVIEKIRYHVNHAGKLWEIDVFSGANAGLVVAEIELQDEAEDFELPDWAGEEVTSDARYFNSQLIKFPFCEW